MPLRLSLIVLGLAALAIPVHAHAGAALVVPPLEVDVGETAPIGNAVTGVATDVLVGMHWGSLAWKPTSFELGIGFICSRRALLEPSALDRSAGGASAMSTTPQTSVDLDGGYLALGHTIYDRHHIRTWMLARGELLHGELDGRAFSAIGAAMRIASELYAPVGASGGRFGGVVGTFAVGVYVEASHRALPDELGADGVTTGLSIRVPFMVIGN